MLFRHCKHALLSLTVIAVLGTATFSVEAQGTRDRSERSKGKDNQKEENKYPDATREEPKAKGSPKLQSKLQKLIETYNKDDFANTRAQADEVLANEAATAYDKSIAAQLASQAAYNLDDTPATMAYLKQALELNGLDNNSHYQLLYMLGGLQLQEDQYAEGLATLDRYFAETKSVKPEELALKGQGLYQAERYAEAIPVLKQAIETAPEPKDNWQQLLMASYAEVGQSAEATQMAEKIAAKSPNDKKAQMNLANVYLQADKYDQAAAILEKMAQLRAADRRQGLPPALRHLRQYGRQGKGGDRGDQRRHAERRAQARPANLSGLGAVLLLLRTGRAGDRGVAEGRAAVQGRRNLSEPGQGAVAGGPHTRSQAGGQGGAGQGHQEAGRGEENHRPALIGGHRD